MTIKPYDTWEKTSIELEEKKHMVTNERLGNEAIPFGSINYQWVKLLSQMQDDDELFSFRSDDRSWARLAGTEGIALVRNGVIVDEIITLMN
ncbi:hypothetical protein H8D36_05970 [archaeon]|nr:hypothetical protein [archaeon]